MSHPLHWGNYGCWRKPQHSNNNEYDDWNPELTIRRAMLWANSYPAWWIGWGRWNHRLWSRSRSRCWLWVRLLFLLLFSFRFYCCHCEEPLLCTQLDKALYLCGLDVYLGPLSAQCTLPALCPLRQPWCSAALSDLYRTAELSTPSPAQCHPSPTQPHSLPRDQNPYFNKHRPPICSVHRIPVICIKIIPDNCIKRANTHFISVCACAGRSCVCIHT